MVHYGHAQHGFACHAVASRQTYLIAFWVNEICDLSIALRRDACYSKHIGETQIEEEAPMPVFTRQNSFQTVALSLVVISFSALAERAFGTRQTMTGGSVAAAFRGEWVPAKARCTSPLRLIIEPNVVTFVKGDDREEFRKLEQCFTCIGSRC